MDKLRKSLKEFQKNWDAYTVIYGGIFIGVLTIVLSIFSITYIAVVLSFTLCMLGLLAVSIRKDRSTDEKIMKSLLEQTNTLSSLTKNQTFEQLCDAYKHLIKIIEQYGAKEAILLQYSSSSAVDLVRTLLSKGAIVTIYIQDEQTAKQIGSQLQSDRIIFSYRNFQTSLGRLFNPDKLKVWKYPAPCSMCAVKIDNLVLCMGWYVYEQVDRTDYNDYSTDTVEVSGHDIAAMVVWEGTQDFKALDKTFRTMKEIYEKYSEEVPLK